jgi:hypothetical protein
MMEPDERQHHIFQTFEEAMAAYVEMQYEQLGIAAPRQSHGCWIYDKIEK